MISSNFNNLLSTSNSIKSKHKVTMEWNYNGFIPLNDYGCYLTNDVATYTLDTGYDNGVAKKFFQTDSESNIYLVEDNKDRKVFTPLEDCFKPNRPDPGIIHLTSFRKNSKIIDLDNLKIGNLGNASNGERKDRVYPIYKNSTFRYWNSVRQLLKDETVGISGTGGAITHASPFVIYSESFYVNKISVKTQKYQGYPVDFKIEYLPETGNTWNTALSLTGSALLEEGKLDIYYDGTSWSTNASEITVFTGAPSNAIKIKGVRFTVTKMSSVRVPLEVIEISPRLLADVSDYILSFDKSSSLSSPSFGIPVAGTVSGTGSLMLSNIDRIFSSRNTSSILSDLMVRGVEVKFYQTLEDPENIIPSEKVNLGTFYTESWSENTDFTTSINLEDFFMILKSKKAPDISIANINGIEASVALMILFDNAGITNYNFKKLSETSQDDFVIDFFFSNKDQTLAEVVEQIALSAQYAIFMDSNNIITAVTKEKMSELVSPAATNYWFIGSEDYSSKTENTYISGKLSNIQTISESIIIPLTDATISYKGNGIQRSPMGVLKKPELFNDKNVPYYNASVVTRDLSFTSTELWSLNSNENGSDKALLSMPYILDISNPPEGRPSIIDTNATENNNLTAESKNELIRLIYKNSTAEDKKYFEIVLDQERGVEFLQAQKFSGHIVIDSELVKYNGLVVDIFDDNSPENIKRAEVVFSQPEVASLISKSSSGSSVVCYSMLIDLNYIAKDRTDVVSLNEVSYQFVSDGRAQENTAISEHLAQTSSGLITAFSTKLYASTISSKIKAISTMSAKSINLINPLLPKTSANTTTYPGYLKLSGPKSIGSKNKKTGISSAITKKEVPIDNFGERFITGFYTTLGFEPSKISTRVRLLSKPKKYQFTSMDSSTPNYKQENRGIAGIGFNLNRTDDGTTGYFLELEDVGNITDTQLEDAAYENLRLYSVSIIGGVYKTKVLKKAWVNVSAVAGESIDFSQSMINEGRSYAGTSDLSIVIVQNGKNTIFKIYWEGQMIAKHSELTSKVINRGSSKNVGLMVRSDSEAMFDYLLAASVEDTNSYKIGQVFGGSEDMKIEELAERGYLPSTISNASTGSNNLKVYMEDFGRQLREAKKFNVKFENPSISARMISLARLNKDYSVSNFSFSSYGAEFWVFNTSRASIGLSTDKNTPVMISGLAISELNPGEVSLTTYINNVSGEDNTKIKILEENKNKYGENSISFDSTYINSYEQAEDLLKWIFEHENKEKREFSIQTFTNPLLEIGDKVRVFYSDIEHEMSKIIDSVYYITGIDYSVDGSGPNMTVTIREI